MSLQCRFTFIEDGWEIQDDPRRSRSCPPAFNHADRVVVEKRAMMQQMAELEVRLQQLRSAPSPKLQENAIPLATVANPGSYGHPQLCNRPCINFLKGTCKLAEECGFCHSPHVKFTRFDMQQRQLLATLPKSTLLAIVLPHLQQRMQDHGLHQAMHIVEMVERELVFQITNGDEIMASKELFGISKVLKSMPFAALVGAVSSRHIKGALPKQIREALIELRTHISHWGVKIISAEMLTSAAPCMTPKDFFQGQI